MKILVLCFLGIIPVYALDNGLGLTPPLGYNSYDHIGCCANETSLKEQGKSVDFFSPFQVKDYVILETL